eukprot:GILK01003578.1.p1 GENE.GILK01003578.1~~GILK01003578.1.p1  ORF type:complete len:785 (+),score=118.73 GILK01003578.1:64-2418(+)
MIMPTGCKRWLCVAALLCSSVSAAVLHSVPAIVVKQRAVPAVEPLQPSKTPSSHTSIPSVTAAGRHSLAAQQDTDVFGIPDIDNPNAESGVSFDEESHSSSSLHGNSSKTHNTNTNDLEFDLGHDHGHSALLDDPDVASKRLDAFVILVILIILLSVLFEKFQHWLIHKLHNAENGASLVAIIRALFSELTVLGFIGVLLFVLNHYGVTKDISKAVFCPGGICPNGQSTSAEASRGYKKLLPELFETVHMLIFVIMVTFIVFVVCLLIISRIVDLWWKRTEERSLTETEQEYRAVLSTRQSLSKLEWFISWRLQNRLRKLRNRLDYHLIRNQFIHPRRFDGFMQLPENFHFFHYLSLAKGRMFVELVEIPLSTWIIVMICAVLMRFIIDADVIYQEAMYTLGGFIILAVMVIIMLKLWSIKGYLLPMARRHDNSRDLESEQTSLLSNDVIDEDPKYQLVQLKLRSRVVSFLFGKPMANKHERLFWLDELGPKFILYSVQLCLFLTVIHLAFFVLLLDSLFSEGAYWGILWSALSLVSTYCCVFSVFPNIVRHYVTVTMIEHMKNDEIARTVLHLQHKTLTRQRHEVLRELIRRFKTSRPRRMSAKMMSPRGKMKHGLGLAMHVAELEAAFDAFDRDRDGFIDVSVALDALRVAGIYITGEQWQDILISAELELHYKIDFAKFKQLCSVRAELSQTHTEETVEETVASYACLMNDTSHTVSVQHLQTLFKMLGQPIFEIDAIACIKQIRGDDLTDPVKDELFAKWLIESRAESEGGLHDSHPAEH